MPRSYSPHTLQRFLDVLAVRGNYADAMQAVGYGESLAWQWMMKSRHGDPHFILDFRGEQMPLHQAVETIRREWNETQFSLRADSNHGRLAFDKNGAPLFMTDLVAIAQWEGDAKAARELGGLHDPFYLHEVGPDGQPRRIQVRNPIAPRVRPDGPGVRELERQLAELKTKVDRITKPEGVSNLGIPRAHPRDPEEHVSHSDTMDDVRLADPEVAERAEREAREARAKRISAIAASQRGVPAQSLDRGERVGRGVPPSGGMKVC
jgi:hypothetical protein